MIIGEALSIPIVGFICQPDHKIEAFGLALKAHDVTCVAFNQGLRAGTQRIGHQQLYRSSPGLPFRIVIRDR